MQCNRSTILTSTLFLAISLTCFPGNIHSQTFPQINNAISPPVITHSYLDSTRNLTIGNRKLNATYLSLVYNFRDIDSVEWIYEEVKVPKGEAPLKTYYCAIQGYKYYCGLQTNSQAERRIIFSVWDTKDSNNKENKVPIHQRASLITAGDDVVQNRFGGEGTGIHTHYRYNWQEDSPYKFLIHSVPDTNSKKNTITLFVEIEKRWKLIAKIVRPECIGVLNFKNWLVNSLFER